MTRSTLAVVSLLICIWLTPSSSGQEAACLVPGGFCPIASAQNGASCYCETLFGNLGGVGGAPKEDAKSLLEDQVKGPITVQIFASKGSLATWIAGLNPTVEVIYASSRKGHALGDEPLS